jgi:putative ABC transport system permease protein
MSLWQIAVRNVWQSRSRYLAYLGSAAFSVMIYFLYTALQLHPMAKGGGYRGAAFVAQGMKGTTVVIAIFTFLFLLYSNSAFVRSRMKEFGLLSLMGLSRGQLAGLILTESLLIGAVATAAGLGAALLFEKLFFMAISALLRLPEQIPFYAGLPVWLNTAGLFGGFFILVSLASLRSVLTRNIIGLVRAGRQPKGVPTFSRWKAVLGLVLVLGGYAWAAVPVPVVVFVGIMPVTAMVSVGTYLLMREGSIAFLSWLHRRERFFYRPGSFLNVSQLVYKMQDNFRVLSAVAVLVAVILSAVGTAATLYMVTTADAIDSHPHAIQIIRAGGDPAPDVARVDAVLQQHRVTGLTQRTLTTRTVLIEQTEAAVVPYSFYTSVGRRAGEMLPLAGTGDAILVNHMYIPPRFRPASPARTAAVTVDGEVLTLSLRSDNSGRITNVTGGADPTLVVSDETFQAIMAQTPADRRVSYLLWDGPGWRSGPMQQAGVELRSLYGEDLHTLTMTEETYLAMMSTMGMILFIGLFISLVFFAATFSLLYFRLFTEIDEDRKYFRRLQQVGVSTPELKGLALRQAGVIFLVPFLVGLIHSTFAMQALGTFTARTVLQYGWAMAAGYLVLYGAGFAFAYKGYWRSLQAGLSAREA